MMQLKQTLTKILTARSFQLLVAASIILVLLPLFFNNNLFLTVLTLITIFSVYASSWNFLANSGQGSLGHAAFLGIGGFASAIIGASISAALVSLLGVTQLQIGALSVTILIVSILLGGLLSSGIGLLIGLACVRLKAWYLAMVTFGFSVIAATLSTQFDSFTHGINGFATATLMPKGFPFFVLVVVFSITSISIMYLMMKSRMGLAFKAIHGNEPEAKMIGINTAKYKLIAFVISTFFAGIAGGLNVYYIRFVDNSIFSAANSFAPLIMTVIGGLGTVAGPIIGSAFLITVQQTLAQSSVSGFLHTSVGPYFPLVGDVGSPLSMLFIGVILVLIVIFSPKGLMPIFRKLYNYIMTESPSKGDKKP
jgi:branched-chain amino acid transport system permease protein